MGGNFDDQKSQRIEQLEGMLEEHKKEIENLTTQLASKEIREQSTSPKRPREDEPEANKEAVGQLTRKIRKLQEGRFIITLVDRGSLAWCEVRWRCTNSITLFFLSDLSEAEKAHQMAVVEVQSLQKRLAAAETTSQLRVLQLKDNPTSRHEAVKKETLDSLREENAALVAQLEGRPGVGKLVPISTLENTRLDIKEMEKVIAEKEKRMQRLKEVIIEPALQINECLFNSI